MSDYSLSPRNDDLSPGCAITVLVCFGSVLLMCASYAVLKFVALVKFVLWGIQ